MTVRIYDADDLTANATIQSTNAERRDCAAYLLGDIVGFILTDLSEIRFRRAGTEGLRFMNSEVTLWKR
ncbi:hypothetical protein KAH43_00520 [Candidatus Bipolaricaulota bacterium]|nr:hypothetical protein [Candidatus Bipolaricaulota bacterium]